MQKKSWVIVALVLLVAAIAAFVLLNREDEPPPLAQAIAPTPPAPVAAPAPPPPAPPAPSVEPAIAHPLTPIPTTEALPQLGQSDAPLLKALREALGKRWTAYLVPKALIHNIVATVDSLPRDYLPASVVPLKRVSGAFITSGEGNGLSIGRHNPERYATHIRLIQSVDAGKLVAVYRQFYPLFQSAYVELGYPKAYFNDRLVEAIDDLLAAPTPDEPILLVQPKVLYEFADPALEARSAGQKIMMRMGRENAARLKTKLREMRQLVVQAPPVS